MNPIGILCTAIASGCGAGLVLMLNGIRVAQDAAPAPVPDALDIEWSSLAAEVGEELSERQRVRGVRADTLRTRYLAGLVIDAEDRGEVAAR